MKILSQVSQYSDLTTGYVYKWTNLINGKMYIGSHSGKNPWYKGSGKLFIRAWKLYGIENFHRDILYVGPNYHEVEEAILQVLNVQNSNCYYNLKNTCHNMSGYKHSFETRKKIASSLTGRARGPLSVQTKEKLAAKAIGRKRTAESIAKSSAALVGRPMSSATKTALSFSNHKRWHINRELTSPNCEFC